MYHWRILSAPLSPEFQWIFPKFQCNANQVQFFTYLRIAKFSERCPLPTGVASGPFNPILCYNRKRNLTKKSFNRGSSHEPSQHCQWPAEGSRFCHQGPWRASRRQSPTGGARQPPWRFAARRRRFPARFRHQGSKLPSLAIKRPFQVKGKIEINPWKLTFAAVGMAICGCCWCCCWALEASSRAGKFMDRVAVPAARVRARNIFPLTSMLMIGIKKWNSAGKKWDGEMTRERNRQSLEQNELIDWLA